MKKSRKTKRRSLAVLAALSAAAISCNKIPSEVPTGTLRWNFSGSVQTRSLSEIPDTDSFILTVRTSAGEVLYEGPYGSSPEKMIVEPGSYTIRAISREFTSPAFSSPQFGDEQVAIVPSGGNVAVRLKCIQLNAGLKLLPKDSFKEAYPEASIRLSSDDGSLEYGIEESRIAYFSPGPVKAILEDGNERMDLFTRYLQAREILSIGLYCHEDPGSGSSGTISIEVDTLRTWLSDDYVVGSGFSGGAPGSGIDNAYGVGQAKERVGESGVWVCGYVVGGDLTSSSTGISFASPFSSRTNIAVASRSSVTEKASCMSVQLSKGAVRDSLNLVDNPELLGRKIFLKGDVVEAYYGIPGIQNITEFSISEQ